MYCYKQMAAFLLFLPFPSATPLFMTLYMGAMWLRFRPCIYCVVLMIITYIATSHTSFMGAGFPPAQTALQLNFSSPSIHSPSLSPSSILAPFRDAGLRFTSPVSPRAWGDFNGGKLLWPVLDGYQLVDKRREQRRQERSKVLASRNVATADKGDALAEEVLQAGVTAHIGDDEHFDPYITDLDLEASRTEAHEPAAEQVPGEAKDVGLQSQTTAGPARRSWFWSSEGTTPTMPEFPAPADSAGSAEGAIISDSPGSIAVEHPPTDMDKMHLLGFTIRRRYDLRFRGMGFVVDLSPARTEDAVQQEVAEWIEWEDRVDRERWSEDDIKWASQNGASNEGAATTAAGRAVATELAQDKGQIPPPPPRGWPWNRYLSRSRRNEAAEAERHRHSGIEHLRLVEL